MKVTFRLPSKAVQYGYAEMVVDVAEDFDATELGEEFARHVKDFWEGEKSLKPKAPDSAAVAEFEKQLGATKISEESNDTEPFRAPWEKPAPAAAEKPWQKKPNLFD